MKLQVRRRRFGRRKCAGPVVRLASYLAEHWSPRFREVIDLSGLPSRDHAQAPDRSGRRTFVARPIRRKPHPTLGLDQWDAFAKPLPAAMAIDLAAARQNVSLPAGFRRFMTSPELQSCVRSCTDCYLDPGQRIVETIGSLPGHLIHFLSDSQSCAHWYLHILQTGESAVLVADDLYCYEIENSEWIENPACRQEKVNVEQLDFRFCSSSFSEFVFRFWIENEIWYAMKWDTTRRSHTPIERTYLGTNSDPASL